MVFISVFWVFVFISALVLDSNGKQFRTFCTYIDILVFQMLQAVTTFSRCYSCHLPKWVKEKCVIWRFWFSVFGKLPYHLVACFKLVFCVFMIYRCMCIYFYWMFLHQYGTEILRCCILYWEHWVKNCFLLFPEATKSNAVFSFIFWIICFEIENVIAYHY